MESVKNNEGLRKATGLVGHKLTPAQIKELKEKREKIVKENQTVKKDESGFSGRSTVG